MDSNFIESLLSQKVLPSPVVCFGEVSLNKIAETICAFLNEQGGWIIVGVNEDLQPTKINEKEVIAQIQYEVTNNIAPLPLVYIQKEIFKGKDVVLITVIKGSLQPYSYNGKYFLKVGDCVLPPTPDQLSSLLRNSFSVKSTWESIPNLFASIENLDMSEMEKVYNQGLSLGKVMKSEEGMLATLSELQLVSSYEVKNGAVCLFGDNTEVSIPQSRVRIQLMSKGKTAQKFDNVLILEGNIFYLLKCVMEYFTSTLPQHAYFIENKAARIEDFLYPMDVLREAVCNSLIHRDYTDAIGEISIFLFSNRIVISNPGKLPKDLIKGKSQVLSHSSILRNPLMAEIFFIGGYMEKTGRGMELISRKMKELGKKPPEWTCTAETTTLTIYNEPVEVLTNERILLFLQAQSKKGAFTKSDYISFFEKTPSKVTAQTDIAKMIELGLCKRVGKGPSTKYRLN